MEIKTLPENTILHLANGTTMRIMPGEAPAGIVVEVSPAKPKSGWENWENVLAKYKPIQHVDSRYQNFSKFNNFSK